MYAVTDKDIKQASEDFMVALENFDVDTPTLLLDACCEVLTCAEMLAIEDADRAVVERRLGRRFRGDTYGEAAHAIRLWVMGALPRNH
jgi:hypothetical protein